MVATDPSGLQSSGFSPQGLLANLKNASKKVLDAVISAENTFLKLFKNFTTPITKSVETIVDKAKLANIQLGANFAGVLTGDYFDNVPFEEFNDYNKANGGTILITINGIKTTIAQGRQMLANVHLFDETIIGNIGGRAFVPNGTHGKGGARDFLQIAINESAIIDITAWRAAEQIKKAASVLEGSGLEKKQKRIVVVAHSQGTMVFYRALGLLDSKTKSMIEFYGNGGEIFVPNNIGLRKSENYFFDNDPIPLNNFVKQHWNLWANAKKYKFDVFSLGRGGMSEEARNAPIDWTTEAHNWTGGYDQLYVKREILNLPKGVRYPVDFPIANFPFFKLP